MLIDYGHLHCASWEASHSPASQETKPTPLLNEVAKNVMKHVGWHSYRNLKCMCSIYAIPFYKSRWMDFNNWLFIHIHITKQDY